MSGNIQFDRNGQPYSVNNSPDLNRDTMALIQKSVYQQPGFYGDQQLSNSNVAFNNAVEIAAALFGVGQTLKNLAAPPQNYVRTPDNYILTTTEKNAILDISNQLASYGVVPYDTLESFFYILASLTSLEDLSYIANVTGVYDMASSYYIRNIIGITRLPDIFKIGYLANAVPSVISKYSAEFQGASNIEDYSQSSTGSITLQARYASGLGVTGMAILSSASDFSNITQGILSQTPPLPSYAIENSINAYSGLAGGLSTLLPSEINSVINSPNATEFAQSVGSQAINSLLNSPSLGGALSSFGSLGGVVANMLLGPSGGSAIGGFMSQVLLGKRLKTSQIANNPMLTPPSFHGKSHFGEAPVSLPATDQVFCRRVASFGSPQGGNGVVSFNMQNFASLGGVMNVTSLVSNLITGSSTPPDTSTYYGQSVAETTSNIANLLNVAVDAAIEPRRSDHSIPFMLGFSAALAGESYSPFPSSHFTDGWKLAASAANDIQKANPQFLITCQSSL